MARHCMRTFLRFLLPMTAVFGMLGCAAGMEGLSDDDDQPRVDARPNVDGSSTIDARIDASATTIDAPVSLPDAATGGDGGIGGCTSHAQCGAGMCCFGMIMCVPGDPLPLPPPLDCIPS